MTLPKRHRPRKWRLNVGTPTKAQPLLDGGAVELPQQKASSFYFKSLAGGTLMAARARSTMPAARPISPKAER
jgi:hypothetical protein